MRIIRIERHPLGYRVWLGGVRLHHGATGTVEALIALALKRPRYAVLGALLMLHDWHDIKMWFRLDRYAGTR